MSSAGLKINNPGREAQNHFMDRQMLPPELPNSHISLRVLPPPKGVMGQFYIHQLNLSRAKLKASSRTSALLSGFAMVAMVEINLDSGIDDRLITAFSVCTTLLVAVHLLALMISTCVLPHVEAVASTINFDGMNGQLQSQALRSPHETMHRYIETAWVFSTVLGIILFLIEIGLLCWIQFHKSWNARFISTFLLVPIVLLFIFFTFQFYKNLVKHTYKGFKEDLEDIERRLDVFHEQASCIQTV
ncbi:UNVERIFIED_CONTAM: hypothetical protein RMT77_013642 [Armadillidium vulgare]